MKIFLWILITIAFGIMVFNLTQVSWEDPFKNESAVALIGVMASSCALLLLVILMISKNIAKRLKK